MSFRRERAPVTLAAVRGIVLAIVALSLLAAQQASAGTSMFVGAAEDNVRSLDPLATKAKMDLAALAGLSVVRMTATWSPGEYEVSGDDRIVLQNVSAAAQLDGVRVILSIYPRDGRTAPLSSRARGEFAQYAASIARTFPAITDFVIGNEPNLNRFWMPQFGANGVDLAARSYELLLAAAYDALKSVSTDVNVIGGALSPAGQDKAASIRQTHSPTAFIRDLGAAYRATHRRRAIMDMFAIHPYLIPSRLPPTFAHPRTTTIGIADYPKLVRLLTYAFAGTGQRGETLPIVYDEFGYQTQIPARKRFAYSNLGAPAAKDAIPEAEQAAYYRQALALAACQPTVAGLLIFHVVDERDARAWQSGLYYANNSPKTSLPAVRSAALAAQAGTLGACITQKTTSNLGAVTFHEPAATPASTTSPSTTQPGTLELDFSCTTVCSYAAQVIDAETGEVVAGTEGKAFGEQSLTIPAAGLATGSYQYVLRALKSGKPGTGEERTSRPFAFTAPAPEPPPAPPTPSRFPRLPQARALLPTLQATVPPVAQPG
jgi:hypothetical protein